MEDQQRDDVTNKPLDLAERLRRIAESYSDGNLVTIHILFDTTPPEDAPASYYWYIIRHDDQTGEDQQVYNGGFIAHPNHQDADKTPTYEYSIHT